MSQFQQPQPPVSKTKNDNGWIIAALILIWPAGLYFMWRDATWTTTTKVFVTIACVVFTAAWLLLRH